MHIVAAYLCKLDYKNGPKDIKKKEKEQIECSKWHLKGFNKLDKSKHKLLKNLIVPILNIIDETIEEIVGIERNIFEAIKQEMNSQKEMKRQEKMDKTKQQEMDKKGKSKINEPIKVEGDFMLDLF